MEAQDIRPGMRMLFPPPRDPSTMFDVYPELLIVRCFSDLTPLQMAFVAYLGDYNSPARVLSIIDKRDDTYIRERVCMAMGIDYTQEKYYINKSNDKVEHAIYFFKNVIQNWDEIGHLLELRDLIQVPLLKAREYAGKATPQAMYNYKLMMEEVRKEMNRNDIGKLNARIFHYLDRIGRTLIKDGELLLYEEETKKSTELHAPASLIKARANGRLAQQAGEGQADEVSGDADFGEEFN
jgi:hypothetical protein